MLSIFLGYLLIGLCTIFGAVTIHVFRALYKGYDVAKWWNENYDLDNLLSTTKDKFGFVLGLLIWPARLASFLRMIPYLYEQYEPIQR